MSAPVPAEVAWSDPRLHALRTAQQAELRARYGDDDVGHEWDGADALAAVLVTVDDEPVACGVLRDAADLTSGPASDLAADGTPEAGPRLGELKRLFVVPSARGRGLSRLVVEQLEAAAAHRGLTRLVLETGVLQPEAIGLYLSAGYAPIDRFAPYEAEVQSRCFAKDLAAPPAQSVASASPAPVVGSALWEDPELVALRREMALYLRGLYGAAGYFADDESFARAELAGQGRRVLVARDPSSSVLLGTVTLVPDDPARPPGWGRLERLFVDPAARGRGVARALLAAVHDEARDLDLSVVGLSTGTRQPAAARLYTRTGYRPVVPPPDFLFDDRLLWFAHTLTR